MTKTIDEAGNDLDGEQTVRAFIIYDPFSGNKDIADIVWESGKSLADYLDGLPDPESWTVFAAGNVRPFAQWNRVALVPGDQIVLTHSPGDPISAIVATVAAASASIASAAAAAGAGIAAAAATIGISSTALIAGAISLGGSLLMMGVQALMAPKATHGVSDTGGSSYGLDGAKNTSQESTVVPVVYGTFRIAGNKVNVYTENTINTLSQEVYIMYVIGEGEIDNVLSVQVNDQDIGNYPTASWDWRPGSPAQAPLNWFANVINPHNVSISTSPTHYPYTTIEEVDRLRFDFSFPEGLYKIDNKGNLQYFNTQLYIHYRKTGTSDWTDINQGPDWFQIDAGAGNTVKPATGIRLTVEYFGNADVSSTDFHGVAQYRSDNSQAWSTFADDSGKVPAVLNTDSKGVVTYSPGSLIKVYSVSGLNSHTYDFQVTGGIIIKTEAFISNSLNISDAFRGDKRLSIFTPPLDRARYDIEVWRQNPQNTDPRWVDSCTLTDINEIVEDTVLYNNTAYYAIKVGLGTDITGEPNTTAIVRGRKVTIYDRNGGADGYRWSDNHADIVLDILLRPSHRYSISPDRIDFVSFDVWRQFIAENDLHFNGAFDSTSNVWDCISAVCTAGRASASLTGLRWGIVLEAPADPTMMFTQDNMIKGTFQSTFGGRKNRANQVEIQYYEEEDLYRQHSVFAVDDTYIADGDALVQATVQLIGTTNSKDAWKEAYLQLNRNRYITTGCSFDVFLQALGCSVGDVVIVQHDMPQWGHAGAVVSSDGTYVIVDSPVPYNGENDWRLLLLQSVSMFACATLAQNGGNKVILNNITAPYYTTADANIFLPDKDHADRLDGAWQWPDQMNSEGGCHSVLIGDSNYRVTDQAVINSEIVLTLDREVIEGAGALVQLFKTDLLCEAAIDIVVTDPVTNTQQVKITSWINHQGSPQPGDRILMGRVGKYKKPFRVLEINYKNDHVRTLMCQEYNETIYGDDARPTPNYSDLSLGAYQVTNVRCQQQNVTLAGGNIQYLAQVMWDSPLNDPRGYGGAKIYVSINDAPFFMFADEAVTRTGDQIISNLNDLIRFKIVAYESNGNSANYDQAPVVALRIAASNVQPDDVDSGSLTAVGEINSIAVNWILPDNYIDVVEVWESVDLNLANAYKVYAGKSSSFLRTGLQGLDVRSYWVRSISASGVPGNWVGPATGTASVVTSQDIQDKIDATAAYAQAQLNSIEQPHLVNGLGSVANPQKDQVVFDTVTNKLYKWDGTQWVALAPMVSIANDGKLTADQIAQVHAASIGGQLTSDQIADLDAAKISGVLDPATIGLINLAKQTTGQLSDAQIASIAAAKLTGQITATQITDNSISTKQIKSASILTDSLAANSVTANQIAANAVTATAIKAGSVTTAAMNAGTIAADRLAAGSITSTQISAGAITAQKIAAGAITAESLAIGSPSNVIWNGCLDYLGAGSQGWSFAISAGTGLVLSDQSALLPGSNFVVGSVNPTGFIGASAVLNGYGCGGMQVQNGSYMPAGAYAIAVWTPNAGGTTNANNMSFPVTAGKNYGAQALACTTGGMSARIDILWFSGDGKSVISEIHGNEIANNWSADMTVEAQYQRSFITGVAPAGCAYAYVRIIWRNIQGAQVLTPTMIFTKVSFGEAPVNATDPGPWGPGGITTIGGNVIKTGTLNASKIVAGSITADKIMANTITAGQIAAGSITALTIAANAITSDKLAANSITAGKILAASITGDQIAANSLYGKNMAGQSIITQYAQANTGVFSALHLQNDSITSFQYSQNNTNYVGAGVGTYQLLHDFFVTVPSIIDPNSITTTNPAGTASTTPRDCLVTLSSSHSYANNTAGNNINHNFQIFLDGNLITSKGGTAPNDYPNITLHCSLSPGVRHEFVVYWYGAIGNGTITIGGSICTVFGRIV